MNEDQIAQRKQLNIAGWGFIIAIPVVLIGFSAAGVEPSRGTSILCLFLLMGAASSFGSAARIRRDANRNTDN